MSRPSVAPIGAATSVSEFALEVAAKTKTNSVGLLCDDCESAPDVAAKAKPDSASILRPRSAPVLRPNAKYAFFAPAVRSAAEAKTDSASLLHLGSATRRRSKAKYAPVKLQPIPKAQGLVNVRKKVKEERRAASIEQVKAELDRLASVLEKFKT